MWRVIERISPILMMLVCGLVAAAPAKAQWCSDGLGTPCGDLNQRICVVDEWWNLSNCPSECKPPYSLRWGVCRAACPGREIAGVCCGDVGQIACIDSPVCAPGLSVADPLTYDPEFLAACVPPPVPEVTPLNGSSPRPVYIMGHNPNNFGKIDNDLAAGANALEPDITLATDAGTSGCPNTTDSTIADLVDEDSSSPYRGGLCNADTHFEDLLKHIATKAQEPGSKLALVLFDIKPSVADAAHVKAILDAIRAHLTVNVPTLNVLLNVGSVGDGQKAFGLGTETSWSGIRPSYLRAKEGVSIDGSDDVTGVVSFFTTGSNNYTNFAYGDGSSTGALDVGLGFGVAPRPFDQAAFLRASVGSPKLLSDAYLLNAKVQMGAFLNAGADSIIPGTIASVAPVPDGNCIINYDPNDDPFNKYHYTCLSSPNTDADLDVSEIQDLVSVVNSHSEVRLATRDDNSYQPKLQSYGVEVTTPSGSGNGTDANLQFTLTGCKGAATMTVNTGTVVPPKFPPIYSNGRMENGQTDHVTIPSKDLGTLESIQIYNDGTGLGPDWTLKDIKISSAGYIGANTNHTMEYQGLGTFSLSAFQTLTIPLKANFAGGGTFSAPTLPDVIAQCSAPLPSPAPTAMQSCSSTLITGVPDKTGPFGQGDTTLTWSFTDASGNTKTRTQTIRVHDTIPPVISCPANIVVNATAPTGTAVPFTVTATDNCTVRSIASAPASGSTFPVGTTTVNNQATDIALPTGNTAACSFTVHVKGAAEQVQDLLLQVEEVGPGESLESKVQTVLTDVQTANGLACSDLAAFMNEVTAQSGKKLTVAQANSLLTVATRIRAVLGCH
jgi:hypothetical protein